MDGYILIRQVRRKTNEQTRFFEDYRHFLGWIGRYVHGLRF